MGALVCVILYPGLVLILSLPWSAASLWFHVLVIWVRYLVVNSKHDLWRDDGANRMLLF